MTPLYGRKLGSYIDVMAMHKSWPFVCAVPGNNVTWPVEPITRPSYTQWNGRWSRHGSLKWPKREGRNRQTKFSPACPGNGIVWNKFGFRPLSKNVWAQLSNIWIALLGKSPVIMRCYAMLDQLQLDPLSLSIYEFSLRQLAIPSKVYGHFHIHSHTELPSFNLLQNSPVIYARRISRRENSLCCW